MDRHTNIYIFNTFFHAKLSTSGFVGVQNWTSCLKRDCFCFRCTCKTTGALLQCLLLTEQFVYMIHWEQAAEALGLWRLQKNF